MDITINTLTRCAGLGHYTISGTVNGVARSLVINRDELVADDPIDPIIARLRSYLKENDITTFAAAKTALEGRSFKL